MPWQDRYLARQAPLDGSGVCRTPPRVRVPDTAPGASALVSVTVEAPDVPGSCKVFWKMVDAGGTLYFPNRSGIFFDVQVTR
ncbi:NBR1-Ig-like domain-containing protein [Nonomuraea pusilla]|uniref:Ig-like domain-containing protein n=1 Tax=Nonomuraea pusilla TaxID=46177 RepID=A0A1H7X4Q7_9ACTN|nr:NBR1-Ig-like domain-containing protein [Nonomuraea pusilla]SEM28119.1 Ig-like domain-containing protein [Nonomuraea pusilla]